MSTRITHERFLELFAQAAKLASDYATTKSYKETGKRFDMLPMVASNKVLYWQLHASDPLTNPLNIKYHDDLCALKR